MEQSRCIAAQCVSASCGQFNKLTTPLARITDLKGDNATFSRMVATNATIQNLNSDSLEILRIGRIDSVNSGAVINFGITDLSGLTALSNVYQNGQFYLSDPRAAIVSIIRDNVSISGLIVMTTPIATYSPVIDPSWSATLTGRISCGYIDVTSLAATPSEGYITQNSVIQVTAGSPPGDVTLIPTVQLRTFQDAVQTSTIAVVPTLTVNPTPSGFEVVISGGLYYNTSSGPVTFRIYYNISYIAVSPL